MTQSEQRKKHLVPLRKYSTLIICFSVVSHRGQEQPNKPKLATMRPDCDSAYIDHVTHMDSQMDKQTDGMTRVVMEALKSCLSRSRFSVGSRRGRKRPKTAVFAKA